MRNKEKEVRILKYKRRKLKVKTSNEEEIKNGVGGLSFTIKFDKMETFTLY